MKPTPAATMACGLLISACGGGGGGLTGTDEPVSGFVISSANAEAAAKVSYEAAIGSSELTELGGSLGITAVGPGALSKASGGAEVTAFLANVMQKIPFGPDTFPCAQAGSITISGNLADPLRLTANDNFVVESAACDDGLGEVINGTLRFTVMGFEGDLLSGAYLVSMDALADNLQVSTAEDTMTSNGDASISLDTRTPLFVTASVAGASMTTDSNASSETLTTYSSIQTLDVAATESAYTLDASGILQTTRLSGSVNYSTPFTFEGVGQNHPFTGQLLVTGRSSSARLIADDDVNVRIEVDSNGDGTVDETITTTWAELTN